MEGFLIMLLSSMVIIIFIFYSKIYINVRYRRNNSTGEIMVDVYIFRRLLAYHMQIATSEIISSKDLFGLATKIKVGESPEQTQGERKVPRQNIIFNITHPGRLGRIIKGLGYFVGLYYRVMGKVRTCLCCEKLEWRTICGTGDAGLTGIITGILWTIKSLLITRLRTQVAFTAKPFINVMPIFGEERLIVDFQCIFSMRLGNVINTIKNLYVAK